MNDYPREATYRQIQAWESELVAEYIALTRAKLTDEEFDAAIEAIDSKRAELDSVEPTWASYRR